MKVKNYSIHPSVYFIVAALLIAYFFPREGKFRYQLRRETLAVRVAHRSK